MVRGTYRNIIVLSVLITCNLVACSVVRIYEIDKDLVNKATTVVCPQPKQLACPPQTQCPYQEQCPPPAPPKYDYKGAAQDDPKLIEFIRNEVLQAPAVHKYNLAHPEKLHFSQFEQSKYADDNFLHGMKDGFFIEAGAVDGEYLSNSLYFERELGWTGLLVEPVQQTYNTLLTRNRKAYSANVAIAIDTKASEMQFQPLGGMGVNSIFRKNGVPTKTIPLYSLLRALDVDVVDFMSIDIESFEVKVLKTIPWDKIKFRLMMIETPHIPEGVDYLTKYLTDRGYQAFGVVGIDAWFGLPELLNQTKKN